MTKKKDEQLTRSEALCLAWKSRKDFKGYEKSRGSAFNSWRSILYTSKGINIGFPDSWRSFDVFYSEVQGEWSLGKIVCRFDKTKPHGQSNSFWAEKGFENSGRLVKIEYKGVSKTIVEWCSEFNLSYQGVRQRYFKGKDYSVEEILFGKKRKLKAKHERDLMFRSVRMLCAYRLKDKKRGLYNDLTIDFFIDEISKGCVYCGDNEKIGLDRIDNELGHSKDNVVPCCYVCNTARNKNFTFEEMKIIGLAIKQVKKVRNEKN